MPRSLYHHARAPQSRQPATGGLRALVRVKSNYHSWLFGSPSQDLKEGVDPHEAFAKKYHGGVTSESAGLLDGVPMTKEKFARVTKGTGTKEKHHWTFENVHFFHGNRRMAVPYFSDRR